MVPKTRSHFCFVKIGQAQGNRLRRRKVKLSSTHAHSAGNLPFTLVMNDINTCDGEGPHQLAPAPSSTGTPANSSSMTRIRFMTVTASLVRPSPFKNIARTWCEMSDETVEDLSGQAAVASERLRTQLSLCERTMADRRFLHSCRANQSP